MSTRGSKEKRKVYDKVYYEKIRKDEGKMEERRKKEKERRKRKRIEESLLLDAQVGGENREKRMRMSKERLLRELEESEEIEVPNIGAPHQSVGPQVVEEKEQEEVEKNCWAKMEKAGNIMMSDEEDIPWYTSLDLPMFNSLVEESAGNLKMTTMRGNQRKKVNSAAPIPVCVFIFMTLFWLRFYPTVDLLLIMFKIHPRTCTKVLKWTTVTLVKTLKDEVRYPSDNEMEDLKNTPMQNHGFLDCVCVVDGSEIQISRPKNKVLQNKTWSGKKKKNSLNVMMITKLDGEIIYYSPFRIGAHDQAHWNELNL